MFTYQRQYGSQTMTAAHLPLIHHCEFRFYGTLNDFLPLNQRHWARQYGFVSSPALRDAIQAQGVPHPEVKLILVNGHPCQFDHQLNNGDRVSVYPHFIGPGFQGANQLGNEPLPISRFILDVHLGKLCRHLRLLGFDTVYGNHFEDSYIIDRALEEGRIILTRDLGILKQGRVKHGYFIRNIDANRQIEELLNVYDLTHRCRPLTRCIRCNGVLQRVSKTSVKDQLPPATFRSYDTFHQCKNCLQVYWRGAHYVGLMRKLNG